MHASFYASAAAVLASTAVASGVGNAVIYNHCDYDVYLAATPAEGGGYDTISKTLSPKDTWTQPWTSLSNGQGWSLKLSKDGSFGSNIIQYEYTFHNDGTIWYDLSEVNGNPWNKNWMITSNGNSACVPRQAAYQYSTDDAYGMQDCAQNSTITVSVCSGDDNSQGLASTVESMVEGLLGLGGASSGNSNSNSNNNNNNNNNKGAAVVAPTTSTTQQAAPSTTSTPSAQLTTTSTPPAQPTTTAVQKPATTATSIPTQAMGGALGYDNGHFQGHENAAAPAPTTMSTQVQHNNVAAVATTDAEGDWVTEVVVVTETATAYKTVVPRHPHFGHHQHE